MGRPYHHEPYTYRTGPSFALATAIKAIGVVLLLKGIDRLMGMLFTK